LDTNKIILNWYDSENRKLPWREPDKNIIDAYSVWISEIMLQQTTVLVVIPYFQKFISRFPNINVLAKAEVEDVLGYWAGLGYYSRARNLHSCAKNIVENFNGVFPNKLEELIKLPGIGDYTASAICAIAYNQLQVAVDVNVKRVISRLNNKHNLSSLIIKKLAKKILPSDRPGDFNEAIMDLGSKICKAKDPKCLICPINKVCKTFRYNKSALINHNKDRAVNKKTIKYGNCYVIGRAIDDKLFFIRRPNNGLLGGMLSFPSSLWVKDINKIRSDKSYENLFKNVNIKDCVQHTFSHFKLQLNIYNKNVDSDLNIDGEWIELDEAIGKLPTLMKKVADTI
jgi:A/G-specific adenine glycosylase